MGRQVPAMEEGACAQSARAMAPEGTACIKTLASSTLRSGRQILWTQVFDQRLVEDPVHRLAVLAAGFDEVARGAVEDQARSSVP